MKQGPWVRGMRVIVVLTSLVIVCGYTQFAGAAEIIQHPGDLNADFHMIMSEAIAYLSGWQQGSHPMAYAIRAAYLWQNGEQYHYVAEEAPPHCWVLGAVEPEGEGEAETVTILLPGAVPMELVRIPAGSFQMGSPDTERSRDSREGPVHTVTIGYDFYMGKYEVTQEQWMAVMEAVPGGHDWDFGHGDRHPAYYVSWNDAQDFITTLNAHLTATDQGPATLRLPSEAEWEYACRAGTQTRFYFGDSLDVNDVCEDDGIRTQYMWYCGNLSPYVSKPVGGKLENTFRLHDMSGNLNEWCQDRYHSSYTEAPSDGSAWDSTTDTHRVHRGGNYDNYARNARSATRSYESPSGRRTDIGFRLVR